MMRVTGVWTVAGRADRPPVLQTFSGAAVATATPIGSSVDVVITGIGIRIVIGVAAANGKDSHS